MSKSRQGDVTNTQVVVAPPTQSEPELKYKNVLYKLGIVEVVLGVLSCVLCIVLLIVFGVAKTRIYTNFGSVGSTYSARGIWCGVFIITSGILGIRVKKHPTHCTYIANIVMGSVAAFFMSILFVMSALSALTHYRLYPVSDTFPTLIVIIHALLAFLAAVGGVICILNIAFAGAGVCCRGGQFEGNSTVVYQPQHMALPSNGLYVMVANQNYQTEPVCVAGESSVEEQKLSHHSQRDWSKCGENLVTVKETVNVTV